MKNSVSSGPEGGGRAETAFDEVVRNLLPLNTQRVKYETQVSQQSKRREKRTGYTVEIELHLPFLDINVFELGTPV